LPILTAVSVQAYRPKSQRREIPDTKGQGLFLIVEPTGRKSFAIRMRRPDGRTAKLTLGPVDFSDTETADEPTHGAAHTLGQARQRAAEIDRKRKRGIDVIAEIKAEQLRKRSAVADAEANSFTMAVREFFKDYETKKWNTKPRRWRSDAATLGLRYKPGADPATAEPEIIKGGLCETWAKKSVTEIDSYLVHTVVDQARKIKNSTARKLHSALSVLFGWLQRNRRVTINPTGGVWKPGPPAPRDRVLNEAEIKWFWQACDNIGGVFGALYQTLLLTGCRLREPGGMEHDELGDNGVWEVPSSRTKNHLTFLVPLPPLALKIKNEAASNTLIFTTSGKTPVSGFSKAKKNLDAEMAKIAGQPIKPWKVHDLRRTFSTRMNESPDDGGLGIAPHIVEAALNHISGGAKNGVAGTYNKAKYLSEKRAALLRWADHIEGLVADRKPKVVPLAQTGAVP
jgi:integrase